MPLESYFLRLQKHLRTFELESIYEGVMNPQNNGTHNLQILRLSLVGESSIR